MNDMTSFRASHLSSNGVHFLVFWFTALFAIVTYGAISTRAILSPYEVHYFVDAKRLFSVAIGTLVLWMSIRNASKVSDHGPGAQLYTVLNVAIPGAIGLLLAREAYDLAASGAFAERFALNLRWMLNWIGYFAAAVAAFIALATHRHLQTVISLSADIPTDTGVTSKRKVVAETYEVADLDFDPRTTN